MPSTAWTSPTWRSKTSPSVIGNYILSSSTWSRGSPMPPGAGTAPRRARARRVRPAPAAAPSVLPLLGRHRQAGAAHAAGADRAARLVEHRLLRLGRQRRLELDELLERRQPGQLVEHDRAGISGRRRRHEARAQRPPGRRLLRCRRVVAGDPVRRRRSRRGRPVRACERDAAAGSRPSRSRSARRSAARTGSPPAPGAGRAAGPRSGSAPRPRRRRVAGSSGAGRRCRGARGGRTGPAWWPSRR